MSPGPPSSLIPEGAATLPPLPASWGPVALLVGVLLTTASVPSPGFYGVPPTLSASSGAGAAWKEASGREGLPDGVTPRQRLESADLALRKAVTVTGGAQTAHALHARLLLWLLPA